MAHDGFLGGFHGQLAWPFDALLQAQHALAGGGWGQERAAVALGSELSSLVSSSSSPSPSSLATGGLRGAALVMDELVGRLGVFGSVAVASPPPPPSSQHASCYSTPVGSPLLAERVAPAPCSPAAGGRKLSRVASSQSLLAQQGGAHLGKDAPCGDGHCRRKRKAQSSKAKPKNAPEPETTAKKRKRSTDAAAGSDDDEQPTMAAARNGGKGKGKEVAAADPHKDYIHVRAGRGQATDSHSLAERVRREKISERMKLLQDLVPSCNKVTGKAVMLDEIINYVQSLQRQVEFLSMKLAAVNPPPPELGVDSFLPKDVKRISPEQTQPDDEPSPVPPPATPPPLPEGGSFFYAAGGFETPPPPPPFVGQAASTSPPHEEFLQLKAKSQIGSFWEDDDLQSVVQMGFRGSS